jgi:hypothetical protein
MELVVETALLHTVAISRNVSWMPQPLRELMIASSSSTRQLVFVLLGLVTLQHRRAARVPPDKRRLVARGAGPSEATIECDTHHRTYTSPRHRRRTAQQSSQRLSDSEWITWTVAPQICV